MRVLFGSVARFAERSTENRKTTGSTPVEATDRYHWRMSLRDPDELVRSLGARLKPFLFLIYVIGLGSAPVISLLIASSPAEDDQPVGWLLAYVLLSSAAGTVIYYLPGGRSPMVVAAYWVAYGAGLFLILGSRTPISPGSPIAQGLLVAIPIYLVAAILFVLHLLHVSAVTQTKARGVDTTGTITRAGVDGMVNFVQHQRLVSRC
jgi:hypothetical protein